MKALSEVHSSKYPKTCRRCKKTRSVRVVVKSSFPAMPPGPYCTACIEAVTGYLPPPPTPLIESPHE